MKNKIAFLAILIGVAMLLASCAGLQESTTTTNNHQMINQNIPVPSLTWSSRRFVLVKYYKILDNPRLRTCTVVTSRGMGNGTSDILGIAPTYGMPVNLSNQVTDPSQSEPDSIFPGPNDQTVFTLRNGVAMVSEADTTAATGDCPPNVHPNTEFQAVIDFESGTTPTLSFMPPEVAGPIVP